MSPESQYYNEDQNKKKKPSPADNQKSGFSFVWLSGAFCAPTRLPLAIALTFRNCFRMVVPPKKQDIIILFIILSSILGVYLTLGVVQFIVGTDANARYWLINLIVNCLGYSTVFLPGYLIIQYVKRTQFLERNGQKCLDGIVRLCVFGNDDSLEDSINEETKAKEAKKIKSDAQDAIKLLSCVFGILGPYLAWGYLQEKIMTLKYTDSAGNSGQFKDSQFLVFVNRILAFAIALAYITISRQPKHKAPLYKYSYCSLTNVCSSWFQYEALKFVSFPTQVLAKACKIIPIMVMGKIVSKKTYEQYEYIVAALICFGMTLFLMGSSSDNTKSDTVTTFSGVLLLMGYMATDSFTSNWQNELFNQHKMSSVQMMCGVNLFSCLLTASSILQQGTLFTSLVFMSQFPSFTFDCVILSCCSAVGQLFIYYTISEFGAVTFIIIMTLRQLVAIIISCVTYNHPITAAGVIGVMVVFSAMFLKIYCGQRLKKRKREATEAAKLAASSIPVAEKL